MRAAAEDLHLRQRQQYAAVAARDTPHSGTPGAAAAACNTAIDVATIALPPMRAFVGVPSSAISARRLRLGLPRLGPMSAARDLAA